MLSLVVRKEFARL